MSHLILYTIFRYLCLLYKHQASQSDTPQKQWISAHGLSKACQNKTSILLLIQIQWFLWLGPSRVHSSQTFPPMFPINRLDSKHDPGRIKNKEALCELTRKSISIVTMSIYSFRNRDVHSSKKWNKSLLLNQKHSSWVWKARASRQCHLSRKGILPQA